MSWGKIIEDFSKTNDKRLNLNNELHLVFYVKNLLNNHYDFTYEKSIKIYDKINNKKITKDNFFYWWCFQRYEEILKEEEEIFKKFNDLKNKINKMIQKLSEIINKESNDDTNKEKINALNGKLRIETEKSNYLINRLKSFRNMYLTKDSMDHFFSCLKILLENA
tara:strand:- start:2561 stop:3055 length:495 start_codon:yes stop_codon:yes gene_type:complete